MLTDQKIKRADFYKNIAEIVAIVIAALWAMYVFYYQNIKTPSEKPPFLVMSSHHEFVGKKNSNLLLRSTITVRNTSDIRARVLASDFNISAYVINSINQSDSGYSNYVNKSINVNSDNSTFPRYHNERSWSLINTGNVFSNGIWWLDPQEEISYDLISAIPDTFDVIRFDSELLNSYDKEIKNIVFEYAIDEDGFLSFQPYRSPENIPLDDSIIDSFYKNNKMTSIFIHNEFPLKENHEFK